jgi:hypothetical protein
MGDQNLQSTDLRSTTTCDQLHVGCSMRQRGRRLRVSTVAAWLSLVSRQRQCPHQACPTHHLILRGNRTGHAPARRVE